MKKIIIILLALLSLNLNSQKLVNWECNYCQSSAIGKGAERTVCDGLKFNDSPKCWSNPVDISYTSNSVTLTDRVLKLYL